MQRKILEAPAAAVDMRFFEDQAYRRGFRLISGIDEAGRGPLAGPVVAAAVIFPHGVRIPGVTDSKCLSARQREGLVETIRDHALDVGIGIVDNTEIDRINILQATFRAMLLAVEGMSVTPDYLLIDGPYRLPLDTGQKGIPRGDARSLSIAAASIIAKVHRDRLMCEYHKQYPQYGFDSHKGYPTARHYEAIRKNGPCPIHRRSFRGVVLGMESSADAKQV